MKDREELNKELDEHAPLLGSMKSPEEGFKVPANYFKTLPDEVLKQIRATEVNNTSPVEYLAILLQRFLQPKYVLAFASVAVIVVAALFWFRQDTEQASPLAGIRLEDISDEALQAYLDNNIENIDRELILETHFAGESGQPLPETTPAAVDDEIEQYLDSVIDEIDMDDLEDIL